MALALMLLLSGCAGPWQRQSHERGIHTTIEGSLRYGPVSGFVQTPNGGAAGTTSPRRPTLRELNINEVLSPEVTLGLSWRDHGLYGGASLVRLGNDSTLHNPLVSHSTVFPAGSAVKSDLQLDSYRIGYQHRFSFANQAGTAFSLSPGIGGALLDFDYQLKGEGGLTARRAYLVGTPQIGLESEWIPPGRFSAAAGVFSSLPEVSNLFLLSAHITGSYRLWGQPERGGALFLGLGFDLLDYEDHQSVPNHIKADMGPMLIFGVKARF